MSRAPLDPRLPVRVTAVRSLLVVQGGCQLLSGLATVGQAVALASVIVSIAHPHRIVDALLVLALLGVLRAGISAFAEYTGARAAGRVQAQLRSQVLAAIGTLGPSWAARQRSGRLVTAAGPGLGALQGYLTRAVPALVSSAIVPALALLVIGLIDWPSALVLIVTLPLVPLFMALVGVTTRRRMEAQYLALARMSGHFLDLVQGLTSLRIYGQAQRQVATVRAATDTYRRRVMTTLRIAFLSALVLDLVATLAIAVVAVDVGLRLDHGSIDLWRSLAVLLLAPELFAPLRAAGAQYHAAEEGRAAAAAALDVLDEADELGSTGGSASAEPAGNISLAEVTVRYPGRDSAAISDLNLTLRSAQTVALTGPSGAGKSTVLSLLLGFTTPTAGSIHVGAETMSALDLDSWRRRIAWVPQLPTPTQLTVAQEVALADANAGADEIEQVLQICLAPPADTQLGEDGSAVSAGQRRRIALARALLRARRVAANGIIPLVLLDEPTEDLDVDTERAIIAVIDELQGWATVVIVTHNRRLAEHAHRQVELREGSLTRDVVHDAARQQRPILSIAAASLAQPLPVESSTPATQEEPASVSTLFGGRVALLRALVVPSMLSAAAAMSGLALTATSLWLICRAAEHPNVQALSIAVVGVRTFALSRALLRYGERLAGHDVALRSLADVRARVFSALVPLTPSSRRDQRRGDALRRFVTDVDTAQDLLVRVLMPLIAAAITAFAATALATMFAPIAGLTLGIGLILGLFAAVALSGGNHGEQAEILSARRDAVLNTSLDGLAELTAYGQTAKIHKGIAQLDEEVLTQQRFSALRAASGVALQTIVSAGTLIAVLAVASMVVSHHDLSAVNAAVLVACALGGFEAQTGLPAALASWPAIRAGLRRVSAGLAETPSMREPLVAAVAPVFQQAEVSLYADVITVSPAPNVTPVLRDASMLVRNGELTVLDGPSGSGKSTLLAALMRLRPVGTGDVDVLGQHDAVALSRLNSHDVPPLVAGSLQGDHVFDASLADNVRLVRPSATQQELDDAARRAGLADVLADLPQGWNSAAGPDGAFLSGGQRQRLLLTRALLADPLVLILDEPTAHLDDETADAVLHDLFDAREGRTVLLSTHRPLPVAARYSRVSICRGSLCPRSARAGRSDDLCGSDRCPANTNATASAT